jgi:hypothetical protein
MSKTTNRAKKFSSVLFYDEPIPNRLSPEDLAWLFTQLPPDRRNEVVPKTADFKQEDWPRFWCFFPRNSHVMREAAVAIGRIGTSSHQLLQAYLYLPQGHEVRNEAGQRYIRGAESLDEQILASMIESGELDGPFHFPTPGSNNDELVIPLLDDAR